MKIYATTEENKKVVLKTFRSAKQFLETESWIDEKWINIATTKELEDYRDIWTGFIVYSDKQKQSLELLKKALLKQVSNG